MDRNQVRVALLKISLVAFAASTWIFTSFVFASRPEESAPSADPISNLMRLPASLPGQIPGMKPVVKTMDAVAMDVMKIPCWDKTGNLEESTDAKWVRLTGRDCAGDGDSNSDSVTVRNLSNGFSATVFPTQGKQGMTTDFIPLETGKNQIQIKFNRGEGATVESQVSFIRE